jgi:aspartate carbamoyltransferase catalytic subunit
VKHLLSIDDLSTDDIHQLFETAADMHDVQRREVKKLPALRGRTVVNMFFEDSTRTRSSFEIAGKWLSADVINVSAKGSSASKGESLRDTVLTVCAMGVDGLVIRHPASGAAVQVSEWVDAAVVNAGDGMHEHPTQALLDAYTLQRHLGSLEGRHVAHPQPGLPIQRPVPHPPRRPCDRGGTTDADAERHQRLVGRSGLRDVVRRGRRAARR